MGKMVTDMVVVVLFDLTRMFTKGSQKVPCRQFATTMLVTNMLAKIRRSRSSVQLHDHSLAPAQVTDMVKKYDDYHVGDPTNMVNKDINYHVGDQHAKIRRSQEVQYNSTDHVTTHSGWRRLRSWGKWQPDRKLR
eukprot:g19809.t1